MGYRNAITAPSDFAPLSPQAVAAGVVDKEVRIVEERKRAYYQVYLQVRRVGTSKGLKNSEIKMECYAMLF